jgi:hypothetical protein
MVIFHLTFLQKYVKILPSLSVDKRHIAQQGKVSGPVYRDIFMMAGRSKSNNH